MEPPYERMRLSWTSLMRLLRFVSCLFVWRVAGVTSTRPEYDEQYATVIVID
jgi:hypothetical protein